MGYTAICVFLCRIKSWTIELTRDTAAGLGNHNDRAMAPPYCLRYDPIYIPHCNLPNPIRRRKS